MPLLFTEEPPDTVMRALAEAIDLVDVGIVLLTSELQLRFVNRCQINMWGLSEGVLGDRPTFRAMLEHVASRFLYRIAAEDLPGYIEQREAAVRMGVIAPTMIDLTDGRRLAFHCVVTPDDGRMLTYTDITRTKRERELQQDARDAAERLGAELRFSNESLESQAVYLASLAEAADEAAHNADQARRQLEHEMTERLQLEAELRRLATTDALTGSLNRAQLLTLGQRELDRVRRLDQELALLMLDIDHFKVINDKLGHAAGDTALRHLVDRLRSGVRQIDLVGRLGGEEFAIILPAIQPQAALLMAERIRGMIAGSPAHHDNVEIRLTVSIGVAMARASDRTLDQVLARADAALYAAKGDGRDCVRSADPPQCAA
jgi:diguanylate cyclase (GGDEF)-like protein